MPASYLGLPTAGTKQLRSSLRRKDRVGLETIHEIYTLRAADIDALTPAYDALHSVVSTDASLYSGMAVEEVDVSLQDGGLAEMQIRYAGLTTSTLPRPHIRALPGDNAIVFFNPYVLEIQFLDLLTNVESVIAAHQVLLTNQFRGTTLPGRFSAPFQKTETSGDNATTSALGSKGWADNTIGNALYDGPTVTSTASRKITIYEGVKRRALTFEKRGLYAVFSAIYAEQYVISTVV